MNPEAYYNPRNRPKCYMCGYRGNRIFWIPLIEDSLLVAKSHEDDVKSIRVWWRCPKCDSNSLNWVTFYRH